MPHGRSSSIPAANGWDTAPTVERQRRILVVEDDRALCETIATVLQADGFEVETAADGRLAIAKLEFSTYDVILADEIGRAHV